MKIEKKTIESITNEPYKIAINIGMDEPFVVHVRPMLTFKEQQELVEHACDCAISDGEYSPVLFDVTMDMLLILSYTDIESEVDASDLYTFLRETDMMYLIEDVLNKSELNELNRLRQNMKDMVEHRMKLLFYDKGVSELTSELSIFISSLSKTLDKITKVLPSKKMKASELDALLDAVKGISFKNEKEIVNAVLDRHEEKAGK